MFRHWLRMKAHQSYLSVNGKLLYETILWQTFSLPMNLSNPQISYFLAKPWQNLFYFRLSWIYNVMYLHRHLQLSMIGLRTRCVVRVTTLSLRVSHNNSHWLPDLPLAELSYLLLSAAALLMSFLLMIQRNISRSVVFHMTIHHLEFLLCLDQSNENS